MELTILKKRSKRLGFLPKIFLIYFGGIKPKINFDKRRFV